MKKLKNILYFLVLLIVIQGCKTSKFQEPRTSLPESFPLGTDSVSIASIDWREYFGDSTLVKLINEGIRNNYDALIALQRIEQSRAYTIFSKGTLLPTASAGGTIAMRRFGLYTMDGAGNATTDIEPGQLVPVNLPDFMVGFQASWEADIRGTLRNRKKAAAARYLSSVEGRSWLVSNLIAEIATGYYDLLALDQEIDIIRSTIALQEKSLSIVESQKEAGVANELAVKQFQAQLLNSKTLEIQVKQRINESESRINFLLGKLPQNVMRNSSAFERESIPSLVSAGIPSDLLRNRPDIRQSELELVAANADLEAAKAAFYPSFVIGGGFGAQAYQPSLLFSTPESVAFNLVGGLSAPLLNRSAIKAEFQAANALQVEALYNYQKIVLNGYTEVYTELQNLDNLSMITEQKESEVSLLSESVQTALDLFNTGRANYLEVLLTHQNVLSARLDLVDAKRQQMNSSVNLYKALGGGWKN